MASVSTDNRGNRRVIYPDAAGKRRILYLGKASLRDAKSFADKVQAIVNAQLLGTEAPREIIGWIADLPAKTRRKLAKHGLAPAAVESKVRTLAQLFKAYFATLTVKGSTLVTYKQTEAAMLEHFGADRRLDGITALDCEGWRQAMQKAKLAGPTIARRVKTARRAFARAVRWKLIPESPMADVKGGAETNRARLFFVTREMSQRVLDACPDAEWRLLFRLCRYGALRCPSEIMPLTWADVLWDRKRIRIHSSKTGERWLPMFPELESALLEVFAAAADKTKHVLAKRRGTNAALMHQLRRIIHRAGLNRWPRIFHNLRASRLTELAERWPIHVVCAWAGNSERIAQDHYLQITDGHFEAAAMNDNKTDARGDAGSAGKQDGGEDSAEKNAAPVRQPRIRTTPTVSQPSRKLRGQTGRPDQTNAQANAPDAERISRALAAIEAYALSDSAAEAPGGRRQT